MKERSLHPDVTLSDIVNLAERVADDHERPATELAERDCRFLTQSTSSLESDRVAFLAWLRWTVRHDPVDRGAAFTHAVAMARWLLAITGFVLGACVLATLVRIEAGTPVNVVAVLGVLVGPQWLLIALFAIHRLIAIRGERSLEKPYELLRTWLGQTARRRWRTTNSASASRGASDWWEHESARDWQRWLLFGLGQRFGTAFALGSLMTLMALAVFTDLAFSWSTSLAWTPETFHQLIDRLAWPWSWALPDYVPSVEMVEATQFSRIEQRYVGAPTGTRVSRPLYASQWWSFVALTLSVYGLLPRIGLQIMSGVFHRSGLRLAFWTSPEVDATLHRLRALRATSRAPVHEESYEIPQLGSIEMSTARDQPHPTVLWRDLPARDDLIKDYLRHHHGVTAHPIVRAGGAHGDLDATEAARLLSTASDGVPVLIVVEAWESPSKALWHFLKALQEKSGRAPSALILPLGFASTGQVAEPDADQRQVWSEQVKAARLQGQARVALLQGASG